MLVCYILTFVNKCRGVVKVVLCCKKLVEMTKNQKNLLCRGVEKLHRHKKMMPFSVRLTLRWVLEPRFPASDPVLALWLEGEESCV